MALCFLFTEVLSLSFAPLREYLVALCFVILDLPSPRSSCCTTPAWSWWHLRRDAPLKARSNCPSLLSDTLKQDPLFRSDLVSLIQASTCNLLVYHWGCGTAHHHSSTSFKISFDHQRAQLSIFIKFHTSLPSWNSPHLHRFFDPDLCKVLRRRRNHTSRCTYLYWSRRFPSF